MAIVVEVLSRNLQAQSHQLLHQDTVSIGRGYACDVRIEDPYVSAEHVVISRHPQSGMITITDQRSINGIVINGKKVSQQLVQPDDVVVLGRTRLRIFDADQPVPDALLLSPLEENIGWMNSIRVCLLLTLLSLGWLLAENYLTTFDPFKWSGAISQTLGFMLVFSIWPLAFGLLSKLAKKEPRLASQFSLLWLMIMALQAMSLLDSWISFNNISGEVYYWLSLLAGTLLFFGFFWFTLFIAFHQAARLRNRIATVLTLAILVPTVAFDFASEPEFSEYPDYDVSLLPPAVNLRTPISTQSFIEQSGQLFDELAAEN